MITTPVVEYPLLPAVHEGATDDDDDEQDDDDCRQTGDQRRVRAAGGGVCRHNIEPSCRDLRVLPNRYETGVFVYLMTKQITRHLHMQTA